MKFGAKSATQDPAHWVEEVQRILPGFDSFTLDCPYPLPEIPAAITKRLRELCDQRGLAYLIHTPVGRIALGDTNSVVRDASIQQMYHAIAMAVQIGAGLIIVHPTPCSNSERATLAQRERLQCEALIEICARADGLGIVIALENMQSPNVYASGFVDMNSHFALLERIPVLGITLDVGHANMSGIPLRDTVLRLGQRLRHVHVHDNDRFADQHLPVGRGTVDWRSFAQVLVQIGYTGVLEFEFQGEAALLASKRYLENLFQ